jgi:hypothetical protein
MEGFESNFVLEYVVVSVSQLSCFCYIWDIFDIVLTLNTVNLFKLGFAYSLWFRDLSQVLFKLWLLNPWTWAMPIPQFILFWQGLCLTTECTK